jgi:hypothetical protein
MISESNILARLLAKENISVQYGNYQTAFFDVEKRVLGLPLWKDRGKDVHTLLVGHEVGHALYTPADGWHSSTTEIPGIPRSYINVVEDVRIEKLVQRTYPGLVSSFKRGYAVLNDEDFFKIAGRSLSSYSVVDRINIKAKLRDLVEVEFTELETPIVEQVMAVETWDDVIEACKALYDFMKEQQQDEQDIPASPQIDFSDEEFDFPENDNTSEDDSTMDSPETTESDSEEDESGQELVKAESSTSEETDGEFKAPTQNSEVKADIEVVETDDAFRESEEDLLDKDESGRQHLYTNGFCKAQVDACIIQYADLKKARLRKLEEHSIAPKLHEDEIKSIELFEQETKGVVTVMAREFEMRKAAYRLQRAQTSKSGTINVNALHSYKYNEDIFRRVTQLADAKSHGMVMFVDYSGSMSHVIGKVIRQAVVLADFCTKVSIPFSIYGFTSVYGDRESIGSFPDHISEKNCSIFELISSTLSRADQKEARETLLKQSIVLDTSWRCAFSSDAENLGSTPLYETILCSEFIIKEFKAKHSIQKVNAIFLTDGEGDSLYTYSPSYDHNVRTYGSALAIKFNNKIVKSNSRYNVGSNLLTELKNIPGVSVIGFYVCKDMYEFKGQVYKTSRYNDKITTDENISVARKAYNKDKFWSVDNTLGYDKYFILKGHSLNTDSDELSVTPHATKAQITKAFKKHASSKKGNRVLATQFAKLVA